MVSPFHPTNCPRRRLSAGEAESSLELRACLKYQVSPRMHQTTYVESFYRKPTGKNNIDRKPLKTDENPATESVFLPWAMEKHGQLMICDDMCDRHRPCLEL